MRLFNKVIDIVIKLLIPLVILALLMGIASVFILREVMVGLYKHGMTAIEIISIGVILGVIGGIRTLAVIYSAKRPFAETDYSRLVAVRWVKR